VPFTPFSTIGASTATIANVVIAKNLDHTSRAVQAQILELLRTRRILTRTSVQTAPAQFLLLAVLGGPVPNPSREPYDNDDDDHHHHHQGLLNHLNDFFFIAHRHDAQLDGFPNVDIDVDDNDDDDDDGASTTSVLRNTPRSQPFFSEAVRSDPQMFDWIKPPFG